METKPWYTSKTILFNLASGIALAVATWMGSVGELAPYAAAVLAIGNFLLRFTTNTAIGSGSV